MCWSPFRFPQLPVRRRICAPWLTSDFGVQSHGLSFFGCAGLIGTGCRTGAGRSRSEEHTSELQSQSNLVCRLLLEKKKKNKTTYLYRWQTQLDYRITCLIKAISMN